MSCSFCSATSPLIFHAGADDVDEGEDAGLGVVDDAVAELGEVSPAGGAAVGDGGDAVGNGHGVGLDAEVAVAPGVVAKSDEDVNVDVDEAGSEVETGDVDGFFGGAGGDGWLDGGDLAIANGNVSLHVDVVLRVDDVAVAKNEIVLLSMGRDSKGKKGGGQDTEHGWEYSQETAESLFPATSTGIPSESKVSEICSSGATLRFCPYRCPLAGRDRRAQIGWTRAGTCRSPRAGICWEDRRAAQWPRKNRRCQCHDAHRSR